MLQAASRAVVHISGGEATATERAELLQATEEAKRAYARRIIILKFRPLAVPRINPDASEESIENANEVLSDTALVVRSPAERIPIAASR